MDDRDVRRMVGMVRAIRAGKWTSEPPAWCPAEGADGERYQITDIRTSGEISDDTFTRAIQTAEAFILLAHASHLPFDETKFLRDCGFLG